ncbi:MAG: WG repeat-containing protein [Muribaculum sp.]|nr:WG repeat-containing protein [Muribaculum sp.]
MQRKKKNNAKSRKRITLYAAVMICILALSGCGRTDLLEPESGALDETQPEIPSAAASEIPSEAQSTISADAQPDTDSQYPRIAESPEGKWMDTILYSEGSYCIYNGAYYGFVTEDGEEIAPYVYEDASPFSEGLACVCLDGKYGYIGKDGETVLPFVYDQAAPFSEGLAYYCRGEEYGFMDREGNAVLQPDCDSVSSFREGYAYFSVDGKYGYLDKSGRIIAEPVYDNVGYFRDGAAPVMKDGGLGLIGEDGREILPTEYEEIRADENYFQVKRDGLWYCFDRAGRLYLSEGWEQIDYSGGLFCVKRDGKCGLFDGSGHFLWEPQYERLSPVPGKELVIVRENGKYGVLDYQGNVKLPIVYEWINYEEGTMGGGLTVCVAADPQDGENASSTAKYGYLSVEDLSEVIPPIYDWLSFVGSRAVVKQNKKYGIIREDGTLEYPIQYDEAQLFEDGSMAFKTDALTELYDCNGKKIAVGMWEQITKVGDCYKIVKNQKYGFLNGKGETALLPEYHYGNAYDVYGAEHIYCMERYSGGNSKIVLVRTGEEAEADMKKALLQNHITPRAAAYAAAYFRWVQTGTFGAEDKEQDEWFASEVRGYQKVCKLFRLEEDGEVLLYVYASPYQRTGFPLSYSGFAMIQDGEATELIRGYECGGSMRGDLACLWYDEEQARVLPGEEGVYGGFGGFSYGGDIYEIQNGEAVDAASFYCISQTVSNYDPEELRDHAGEFYDQQNQPHTAQSIAETSSVTEYTVDGARTAWEQYEKICNRYRYLSPFDLWIDYSVS